MYPPQTSLLPVAVVIAKFIESHFETHGWLAIRSLSGGWFPFWYLGTPFRYLTGPVIPILQLFLIRVFPQLSLFEVTYLLLFLSFIASVVGWILLVKKITKNQLQITNYYLLFTLLIILPWRYFSSLSLSEPSFVIARNILPFVLIAAWRYFKDKDKKSLVIAVVSTAVLLLINTSILAILVVGLAAITLAAAFKKGKIKKPEKHIKPLLIILGLGLLIATFWYGPGYWITILANPSIGGAAGFKVILRALDLLKAAIPLLMAVGSVYFSGKIKSRLTVFSLTWALTFIFLTIFRFIGDPDFWQDWTAWVYELEVGVALIVGNQVNRRSEIATRLSGNQKNKNIKTDTLVSRDLSLIPRWPSALLLIILILPFALTYYVYVLLHRPLLISKIIPQGVRSLDELTEIAGDKRVFLSGSTVFWTGSTTVPLLQVRGGADKAATHPYWDHAAYQLREGSSPELAEGWLEALGVEYILLHGPFSLEAYHDFRNLDKWVEVGEVVWEGEGDVILRVDGVSGAWVVDLDGLKKVASPKSGTDLAALNLYLSAKKRPVDMVWEGPNRVTLNPGKLEDGQAVVVAITFDRGWSVRLGYNLKKDTLGNILILPVGSSSEQIILEYGHR